MILEYSIGREIMELYNRLTAEGKLASRTRLEGYHDTFVRCFGPDRLKSVDGEALLRLIHDNCDRDSLVYWLEFKNDEEFPNIFGSIAGGSALKLVIYRRRDTGAWITGSSQAQREISTGEAIEFARKHREQLVIGAEVIADLPMYGSDLDYKELQARMDKLAPDVSRLAWGHKYFSLAFPDKLDDYHHPGYQRFHLTKLLQIPPEYPGRYVAAGRYVAIAGELGIPLNNLTTVLNRRNGRPYRYWRVGISNVPSSEWQEMRGKGYLAIGWPSLGDLSHLTYNQKSKDEIKYRMSSILPDSSTEAGRLSQQIFYFATLMSNGDLVVASDGPRILDVAKVVGDYRFEAGSDFPHRRRVEWFNLPEWGIPHVDHLDAIIEELGKYPRDLVEIERRILLGPFDTDDNEDTDTPPGIKSVPPLAGWPARIQTALERKSQVILYGPPGTGKTYWAEITARELAARSSFGLEFSQLADEQRSFVVGDGVDFRGLVRMCCFHPAYGYEDFIEGYKPEKASDQMVFNRRDGVFKKLCDDAQAKPDHHFYLIIDEINRGDIPRIFGELLTVLEKNKRGRSIILPLTGAPFQVPPNVYIIATMNTADRSIALLDTALRRRFGFIELMPDFSVFGDAVVEGIPLGPWLEALNKRICTFIGRNARNLQIGHSYLLQGGQPLSDFARFRDVVREDIITLLEEYCYEDYQTMEKILGKGLVDSAKQQINSELFEPHKQDDLIQELLAFCPEVETSHQAVTSNSDTAAEGAEDSADLAAPAS